MISTYPLNQKIEIKLLGSAAEGKRNKDHKIMKYVQIPHLRYP